jgi:hypothetical protein
MIGGLTGVGMLVENDVFLFCSVLVSMASFLSRPWFATGCCREGFLYSGIQCAGRLTFAFFFRQIVVYLCKILGQYAFGRLFGSV